MDEEPVRTPVLPGVKAALETMAESGQPTKRAAGAAALAVRYAELMDEAAVAAKYTRAMQLIGRFIDWNKGDMIQAERVELESAWQRISSALAEHTVASDLGPKLLAALDRLELTPASQPKELGKPMPAALVGKISNPLQLIRDDQAQQWSDGG